MASMRGSKSAARSKTSDPSTLSLIVSRLPARVSSTTYRRKRLERFAEANELLERIEVRAARIASGAGSQTGALISGDSESPPGSLIVSDNCRQTREERFERSEAIEN